MSEKTREPVATAPLFHFGVFFLSFYEREKMNVLEAFPILCSFFFFFLKRFSTKAPATTNNNNKKKMLRSTFKQFKPMALKASSTIDLPAISNHCLSMAKASFAESQKIGSSSWMLLSNLKQVPQVFSPSKVIAAKRFLHQGTFPKTTEYAGCGGLVGLLMLAAVGTCVADLVGGSK